MNDQLRTTKPATPEQRREAADVLARAKAAKAARGEAPSGPLQRGPSLGRTSDQSAAAQLSPQARAGFMQQAAESLVMANDPDAAAEARGDMPLPDPDDDLDPEVDDSDPSYYMRYRGTPMDNPKVRKEIEARCDPIDFGEVISSGRWRQRVPIHPEHLVVVYQTMTGFEKDFLDLFWSRQMRDDETLTPVRMSNLYTAHTLALAIKSINENDLPPIESGMENGVPKFSDEAFEQRVNKIRALPEEIIETLAVNKQWFQDRVNRSMRMPELLGNG